MVTKVHATPENIELQDSGGMELWWTDGWMDLNNLWREMKTLETCIISGMQEAVET